MSRYPVWLYVVLLSSFFIVGNSPTATFLAGNNLIVLEGGTLIDGTGGESRPNAVVAMSDGTIVAVGTKGEFRYPTDATIRDVTGQYIIPGLTDMHAHIPVGPFQPQEVDGRVRMRVGYDAAATEQFLKTLLAMGITTVRSTAGLTAESVALKKAVVAGALIGPDLYVAGNVIDAPPSYWVGDFVSEVRTEEEVRAEVRRQATAGVDFIKLYISLPPELVCAGIEEAQANNIKALGHLSATSWTEAGKCKIDGLVHAIPSAASLLPAAQRAEYAKFTDMRALYQWPARVDLNGAEIDEMITVLVEQRIPVDPTLVVFEAVFWGDDPSYSDHPELGLTPAVVVDSWKQGGHSSGWTAGDFAEAKAAWPKVLGLTKMMYDRGVRILAGSDTPNPFVIPGVSLHRELELLVDAGIPPAQVLKIATRDSAEALDILDTQGTVEIGKTANLVVLTADPLDNIQNTRKIATVFKTGVAFDPQSLLATH